MKFVKSDHLVSGYLLKLIAQNVKLDNLDCEDVSKAYHSFKLVQDLQSKIANALQIEMSYDELCLAVKEENSKVVEFAEELKQENKLLKEELEKIKKPKTTRKRTK